MPDLALAEVVQALRQELSDAIKQAGDSEIRFTATQIDLEFKVGVQRVTEGKAGLRFWVLELGGGATRTAEDVQTVRLSLEPVLTSGERVRIADGREKSPLLASDEGWDE